MCFSIWQEHDKQSISPELVHAASRPPKQSQDALCQLLVYTVARTASQKLLKCSSNQLFSGAVEVYLQPALQERKKERKCGAVKLKKWMKAEHASPRRCIILVDGSPVTLMLWTMNAPQDDKKTRAANLVCGCPKPKKEPSTLQKCDWFFIYTRLSECREWMSAEWDHDQELI